jgi:hypothetical protein
MKITFTPQSRFDALALHRAGDVLTVNGVELDFSALAEGEALPRLVGDELHETGSDLVVRAARIDGRIEATVILPYWGDEPVAGLVEMEGDGPVPVPGT